MSNSIKGMAGCYNSNCRPQMASVKLSLPFIQQAVDVLDLPSSGAPLIIADFGSSQGSNSIHAMKMIIEYLRESKQEARSLLLVHNDLPSNDWSQLFQLLNDDDSYHGVACGRSFYEQCLPQNSVIISHSSTSIHWLSCKPCNMSNHCSILFGQDNERNSFKRQAREDLSLFLQHRSRELIVGGVLIISIVCIDDQGSCGSNPAKRLLYEVAQSLPLTPQELLHYTITEYPRTYEECVDHELFKQNSFELINTQFLPIESEMFSQWRNGQVPLDEFARAHTQFMRSWSESALREALQITKERSLNDIEERLNQFWSLYEQTVKENPGQHDSQSFRTFLVLKKINQ